MNDRTRAPQAALVGVDIDIRYGVPPMPAYDLVEVYRQVALMTEMADGGRAGHVGVADTTYDGSIEMSSEADYPEIDATDEEYALRRERMDPTSLVINYVVHVPQTAGRALAEALDHVAGVTPDDSEIWELCHLPILEEPDETHLEVFLRAGGARLHRGLLRFGLRPRYANPELDEPLSVPVAARGRTARPVASTEVFTCEDQPPALQDSLDNRVVLQEGETLRVEYDSDSIMPGVVKTATALDEHGDTPRDVSDYSPFSGRIDVGSSTH